jgi:hypothetical protein
MHFDNSRQCLIFYGVYAAFFTNWFRWAGVHSTIFCGAQARDLLAHEATYIVAPSGPSPSG